MQIIYYTDKEQNVWVEMYQGEPFYRYSCYAGTRLEALRRAKRNLTVQKGYINKALTLLQGEIERLQRSGEE